MKKHFAVLLSALLGVVMMSNIEARCSDGSCSRKKHHKNREQQTTVCEKTSCKKSCSKKNCTTTCSPKLDCSQCAPKVQDGPIPCCVKTKTIEVQEQVVPQQHCEVVCPAGTKFVQTEAPKGPGCCPKGHCEKTIVKYEKSKCAPQEVRTYTCPSDAKTVNTNDIQITAADDMSNGKKSGKRKKSKAPTTTMPRNFGEQEVVREMVN